MPKALKMALWPIQHIIPTERWFKQSDLGFPNKGDIKGINTGYREVLGGKGGIGGPNQANIGVSSVHFRVI